MSKEAMMRALGVLKARDTWGSSIREGKANAITALQDALAALPAQQEWSNVTDDALMEEVRRRGFVIRDAQVGHKWVGLTDEEITDMWEESSPYYHEDDFARAIEAKLKDKNHG